MSSSPGFARAQAGSAGSEALALVEAEILLAIEQRGLARAAPRLLEAVVDEAVAGYRSRSAVQSLPVLSDGEVSKLRDRLARFGALSPLLDDPAVEEIWVNGPGKVFVSRYGCHEPAGVSLAPSEVEEIVERGLALAGRRLDRSLPFVDACLPDGSRLHVVIPPITDHWTLNIRRFVGLRARRLDELVTLGSLSPGAARFLGASVAHGLNIVVAGSVGAGKTTALACLAAAIPPTERLVVCEEVTELRLEAPDVVAMQCRQPNLEGQGAVTLRDLVRESVRMRADRIIVGEVRGAECLDMLVAMNCGAGGLTSVHANSALEALRKLTTLTLLAGGNVDRRFVARSVASCVDLVVFCSRRPGGRLVSEILSVDPDAGDGEEPTGALLFRRPAAGGELSWSGHLPGRLERFERVGMDLLEVLG
ncbi:MAG: CpaF family protein [Acidimicrobiia bacterium]